MPGYVHRAEPERGKPGARGIPTDSELRTMLTMTRDAGILQEMRRMIYGNTRRDFPCGTLIPLLTHKLRGEELDEKCKNLDQRLYPKKEECTEASTPATSPATPKPTPSSPKANAPATSPTSTKPRKPTKNSGKARPSSSKHTGLSFVRPEPPKRGVPSKPSVPANPRVGGLTNTLRPAVRSTPTKAIFSSEDEMLFQMTESTATRVLEGLKLVRQVKDEHKPKHADMLIEAYEIASLALIEAMDKLKGVRAIQGLNERESAYEKVKILSARDFKTYIEKGK